VVEAMFAWRDRTLIAVAVVLIAATCHAAGPAGAIEAFRFDNAAQEARYRALTEELRCPKCLNTNLAGSDAPIAADLRATVHRLILEGQSDQAIRDYLQQRYGDFILYNPPLRPSTVLLWALPAALLLIGVVIIGAMVRRRAGEEDSLDEAERARLDALLGHDAPSLQEKP
jgi:cytochrome c-type biogenesis protein CcmH